MATPRTPQRKRPHQLIEVIMAEKQLLNPAHAPPPRPHLGFYPSQPPLFIPPSPSLHPPIALPPSDSEHALTSHPLQPVIQSRFIIHQPLLNPANDGGGGGDLLPLSFSLVHSLSLSPLILSNLRVLSRKIRLPQSNINVNECERERLNGMD